MKVWDHLVRLCSSCVLIYTRENCVVIDRGIIDHCSRCGIVRSLKADI